MHKHLVEEIVTSEKTQTKWPVCLCDCLLGEKQPRDAELHEGVSPVCFQLLPRGDRTKKLLFIAEV